MDRPAVEVVHVVTLVVTVVTVNVVRVNDAVLMKRSSAFSLSASKDGWGPARKFGPGFNSYWAKEQ